VVPISFLKSHLAVFLAVTLLFEVGFVGLSDHAVFVIVFQIVVLGVGAPTLGHFCRDNVIQNYAATKWTHVTQSDVLIVSFWHIGIGAHILRLAQIAQGKGSEEGLCLHGCVRLSTVVEENKGWQIHQREQQEQHHERFEQTKVQAHAQGHVFVSLLLDGLLLGAEKPAHIQAARVTFLLHRDLFKSELFHTLLFPEAIDFILAF
jgi:hypothetical protein